METIERQVMSEMSVQPVTETWAQQREILGHRTRATRIQTLEAARAFIDQAGFVLFAADSGLSVPDLFQAIAGRVRGVPDEHDDPDVGKWWGWKDESLDKRWWYYGKLIRKRGTLVSLATLPYFYACSSNYGDYEHDYLEEYRDGLLSAEARSIYEALLENGALNTIDLRKKAHMTNDTAKYRFEKALTELQGGLKVLPVGISPAGAWHYSFIYEIVARWYPDLPAQARPITRREAQKTLIATYLENAVFAPRTEVFRGLEVLGWSKREFEQAVDTLLEAGQAGEVPQGRGKGTYLVSPQAQG